MRPVRGVPRERGPGGERQTRRWPRRLPTRTARDAFTRAAKECIQIHGGIGYTWEHDAHLYLRRAKSSELLFGPPARQRKRLAELAGI